MLFLKLFVLAYLVASCLAVVMVFSAVQDKIFRGIFILAALAMPILSLWALIATVFTQKSVPCFEEEIARVEDEIESERIRIFGGERIYPSFGKQWEIMYETYVEKLALQAARASDKIASLAGSIRSSLAS